MSIPTGVLAEGTVSVIKVAQLGKLRKIRYEIEKKMAISHRFTVAKDMFNYKIDYSIAWQSLDENYNDVTETESYEPCEGCTLSSSHKKFVMAMGTNVSIESFYQLYLFTEEYKDRYGNIEAIAREALSSIDSYRILTGMYRDYSLRVKLYPFGSSYMPYSITPFNELASAVLARYFVKKKLRGEHSHSTGGTIVNTLWITG